MNTAARHFDGREISRIESRLQCINLSDKSKSDAAFEGLTPGGGLIVIETTEQPRHSELCRKYPEFVQHVQTKSDNYPGVTIRATLQQFAEGSIPLDCGDEVTGRLSTNTTEIA